jgi:hypothetical protein
MSERVPDGIPADAGFTFADVGSVIAAAEPDANHDALRLALIGYLRVSKSDGSQNAFAAALPIRSSRAGAVSSDNQRRCG